jgi:hypothetical protein
MNKEIIRLLAKQRASSGVGSSTLRGHPNGIIPAAREALNEIEIENYSRVNTEKAFLNLLERDTQKIMTAFPKKAKDDWGAARKVLNIFLRDLCYYKYTCRHYKLERIEKWLEVPLDSYVAKGLRHFNGSLRRWPGIKGLQRKVSDEYQEAAARLAKVKRINKVDLDIIFWRNNGEDYLAN